MPLRLGILIAGSLEWEDQTHRVDWRNAHLTEAPGIPVKVPIRYGRRSRSRANTYTMVFAPGCPDGQGKVFECQRGVTVLADLVEEAKSLWTAERPAKKKLVKPAKPSLQDQQHSWDWGCVALLGRLEFPGVQQILNDWGKRARSEKDDTGNPTYDSAAFEVNGKAGITNDGLLAVNWPTRADTGKPLDSFDLLLATATRPTCVNGAYPDAKTLADAWNSARTAVYFWMNRRRGFWTFEDAEIERHLRF